MGNVTVWNTRNNYVCSPRNLHIAYGTDIFATLVIAAIGLFCINKALQSYGKSFSTILRTTRNAELSRLIDVSETSGAEPLPNIWPIWGWSFGLAVLRMMRRPRSTVLLYWHKTRRRLTRSWRWFRRACLRARHRYSEPPVTRQTMDVDVNNLLLYAVLYHVALAYEAQLSDTI